MKLDTKEQIIEYLRAAEREAETACTQPGKIDYATILGKLQASVFIAAGALQYVRS